MSDTMSTETDPFEEQELPTKTQLNEAYHTGQLSGPAYRRLSVLLGNHPDGKEWRVFVDYFMLFAGAAFLLSGVIFFFAYNWSVMGRYMKFALLEGGIMGASLLAWYLGLDKLSGKASLLVAAILIGPLLAVFGQTYQTGADPYELFTGWAMLALGWVAVSRFGALWIFWLTLLNIGLWLYCLQILSLRPYSVAMMTILGGFNAIALVVWTVFQERGTPWLQTAANWAQRTLFSIVLYCFSVAFWLSLVNRSRYSDPSNQWYASIGFFAVMAGGYYYFRRRKPDLYPLSTMVLSIIVIDTTFIATFVKWREPVGIFFFLSLFVIAQATAGVYWLLRIKRSEAILAV